MQRCESGSAQPSRQRQLGCAWSGERRRVWSGARRRGWPASLRLRRSPTRAPHSLPRAASQDERAAGSLHAHQQPPALPAAPSRKKRAHRASPRLQPQHSPAPPAAAAAPRPPSNRRLGSRLCSLALAGARRRPAAAQPARRALLSAVFRLAPRPSSLRAARRPDDAPRPQTAGARSQHQQAAAGAASRLPAAAEQRLTAAVVRPPPDGGRHSRT